ncbi:MULTISPECIES: hypothetical protein [unclassified Streptomyces]|uniref:hypothetical protein n=1 Tax=unclassified Streptomyces TaxID=2593676 RepID=UPI00117E1ED0|nr:MULTISPECIES: hypothetical protein [unclassified Streptomyces]MYQ39227.1 hypothetical protein [Streptomyces sp. SID4921]
MGRPDGADQFHHDVQLLPADIQSQFRNRYLPVRHAQLPPEAHEVSTLLRLAIIRKAAGDHRLDALPLLGVAESVTKVRQSHGRTVPTALTSPPGDLDEGEAACLEEPYQPYGAAYLEAAPGGGLPVAGPWHTQAA